MDIALVVLITATTLSFSYAADVCESLGCGESGVSVVKTLSLVVLLVALGMLTLRAFRYKSIDHSNARVSVSFLVVLAASTHTITHDICHMFPDGVCGSIPSGITLFLVLASTLVVLKPRAAWPVNATDTAHMTKLSMLTGGTHARLMLDDRHLFWWFWASIISLLWVVWVSDVAAWLFDKEETLTMLVVGLFGPLIALYFANHERNKRIEENYEYKTRVLIYIDGLLQLTISHIHIHLPAQQTSPDGSNINDVKDHDWSSVYKRRRDDVVMLNTNIHVPAQIRSDVNALVNTMDNILIHHLHLSEKPDISTTALKQLVRNLAIFLPSDSEYFTTDHDVLVQQLWGDVRQSIRDVEELVAKHTI